MGFRATARSQTFFRRVARRAMELSPFLEARCGTDRERRTGLEGGRSAGQTSARTRSVMRRSIAQMPSGQFEHPNPEGASSSPLSNGASRNDVEVLAAAASYSGERSPNPCSMVPIDASPCNESSGKPAG